MSMSDESFTSTVTVDQSPEEAFAAITDVRGSWSPEVKADTEKQGDVFLFEVPGVHVCTMTLSEVVPAKRVVWECRTAG